MGDQVVRSDVEVDKVAAWAAEAIENGLTTFPSRTYEEGVFQTILWLTGDSNERPDVP